MEFLYFMSYDLKFAFLSLEHVSVSQVFSTHAVMGEEKCPCIIMLDLLKCSTEVKLMELTNNYGASPLLASLSDS